MSGLVFANGVLALNNPAVQRGTWTSIPMPADAIERYTESSISWQATQPANTQLNVYVSFNNGPWIEVQNETELPGLIYGQCMREVSVRLLVSLQTSDPLVTPTIDDLSVTIEGVSFPIIPSAKLGESFRHELNTPFDRDPQRFLALSLNYDGELSWSIKDRRLITEVRGGSGTKLDVYLPMFTLQTLVDYLDSQAGYEVTNFDSTVGALSATLLLQGEVKDSSEVQHLWAYTSLLWVYLEAVAFETQLAKYQVTEMLKQMQIDQAQDEWADYWGKFFYVFRMIAETDQHYTQRIVTDPFKFRCNNLAVEQLVEDQTSHRVQIVDLDWRDDNLLITNQGPRLYQGVPIYEHVTQGTEYVVGPVVANSKKRQFLASLGITQFADGTISSGGYPYYGDPANNNALVCAFAVILGNAELSETDKLAINGVVDHSKQAGTVALYFEPLQVLHTNRDMETTQSDYVVGPGAGAYTQITI